LGSILKQTRAHVSLLRQLNIGPRLTLCFAFIILAMLAGDAILLWQFQAAQAQAERLRGVDEELITVLQAHANLMSFYEVLDVLAHSEDTAQLLREAENLNKTLRKDSGESRSALNRLPPEVQPDPALQPALEAMQQSLPSQLEAIKLLAQAGEWQGVRLRLANEIRPLESRLSILVSNLNREVSLARAETVANMKDTEHRVFLIVPMTALLTFLFAALLGVGITRSITQPLGQLVEASRALGRGEFQHRVATTGRDELAHLAQALNESAATLQNLYVTLHRREADLAEAQRLSHTGSFGWNPATGELAWSDETFRVFEYSQKVKPTIDLALQRIHPEDRYRVQEVLDRVSHNGTGWDFEHRLLMPDGSIKYVRSVTRATRDSSGQPSFIGAVVDLTPRKRAEEALRQAQATLARVARVTTLGELTASIAHEINQPLAAAITNSNTCLRWLARTPPNLEEARAAALRCSQDATRVADIIKRIRILFKKGEQQREVVDVNEIIQEMIALFHQEADSRSVSIRSDLTIDLPTVSADRVQLQQVLMNLMLNGMEAMKGNGGELIICSQPVEGEQLFISVSDTGVGLPPEHVDRIFDAFFTTKPDGTGMGLAISRSIIESHGGRLWVTANSGRGATFCFTLPRGVEARP
jgi:signal transduction histidine kinase